MLVAHYSTVLHHVCIQPPLLPSCTLADHRARSSKFSRQSVLAVLADGDRTAELAAVKSYSHERRPKYFCRTCLDNLLGFHMVCVHSELRFHSAAQHRLYHVKHATLIFVVQRLANQALAATVSPPQQAVCG